MSTIQPTFRCGQTTVKFSPQLIIFVLVSLAIHLVLILSSQMNLQPDSGGTLALRVHLTTAHNERVTASKIVTTAPPQTTSTSQSRNKDVPKLVAIKKRTSQSVLAHKPANRIKQKPGQKERATKKIIPVKTVIKTAASLAPPAPSPNTLTRTSTQNKQPVAKRDNAISLERSALTQQLQRALKRYFNYPLLARRRGWQGEVVVSFTLGLGGKIMDLRIATSSGHNLLDRAALTTLRKIERIATAPQYKHSFELPVIYQLQDG